MIEKEKDFPRLLSVINVSNFFSALNFKDVFDVLIFLKFIHLPTQFEKRNLLSKCYIFKKSYHQAKFMVSPVIFSSDIVCMYLLVL